MENALKVYIDNVNSFSSFLELNNEVDNTKIEKNIVREIHTRDQSKSLLIHLMKKLRVKYNE